MKKLSAGQSAILQFLGDVENGLVPRIESVRWLEERLDKVLKGKPADASKLLELPGRGRHSLIGHAEYSGVWLGRWGETLHYLYEHINYRKRPASVVYAEAAEKFHRGTPKSIAKMWKKWGTEVFADERNVRLIEKHCSSAEFKAADLQSRVDMSSDPWRSLLAIARKRAQRRSKASPKK